MRMYEMSKGTAPMFSRCGPQAPETHDLAPSPREAVKARRGAPGARFPEFQTGLLLLRSFIAKEKRITGIIRLSKRLLLIVAVLYNTD